MSDDTSSHVRVSHLYDELLLRYGIHKLFGSLPAVILTFNLLTPKANQHINEPKNICDQDWMKFPSFAFEI